MLAAPSPRSIAAKPPHRLRAPASACSRWARCSPRTRSEYLTSPTLRGLFVRDQLLCQHISLPENFTPPPIQWRKPRSRPRPARELYELHARDSSCRLSLVARPGRLPCSASTARGVKFSGQADVLAEQLVAHEQPAQGRRRQVLLRAWRAPRPASRPMRGPKPVRRLRCDRTRRGRRQHWAQARSQKTAQAVLHDMELEARGGIEEIDLHRHGATLEAQLQRNRQ